MGGARRGASAVTTKPKKPRGQRRVLLTFADGPEGEISLAGWEKAHLDDYQRMVASDDPGWKAIGKSRFEEVARRLADHTIVGEKKKRATKLAASARRKIGDDKAKLVLDAIAKGIEPPVGERQLRRIKKRQMK
jgi:hypothetical protein